MYLHQDEPNFASFAAAARAGNPDSILAFNHGVIPQQHPATAPEREVITLAAEEDYTAGEVSTSMVQCHGRFVGSAQWHILSYLGSTWGHGPPRFTDRWVIEYVRELNHNGGTVTWDVPIQPNGTIPAPFFRQLKAIGAGLKRPRPMTPAGNLASYKPARLLNLPGRKTLWVNGAKHFARCGVDGDPATFAQASGQWPWTYEVDLLVTAKINKVVVTFPADRYASRFKILLAATGHADWQEIAEKTAVKGGPYALSFPPTPARLVRVQALEPDRAGQPGGQMAVAELEVRAQ